MDSLDLQTTAYSRVSQARSFRLPGYLIVEPLRRVGSLDDLGVAERGDLADALAAAERWIHALGSTERVYQLRFGESDGAVHFHVVPRTARVLEGYLKSHSEGPPYSGARIVDWLWFQQDELGYSEADVSNWVERARALVAAETRRPKSWTRMAQAASQYCRWIESLEPISRADSERQRSIEARDLLLTVLSAGSGLEEVEPCNYQPAGETPEDAALPRFLGDFSDDLADIWRDLKEGLHLWEQGNHQRAAWEWWFRFQSHWGLHAVDALRELQIYTTWRESP